MTDWQPIETAPKDGTNFLAAIEVQNNKTGDLWWEQHVICVDEDGDIPVDIERGWSFADYTHWMPLPKAPT